MGRAHADRHGTGLVDHLEGADLASGTVAGRGSREVADPETVDHLVQEVVDRAFATAGAGLGMGHGPVPLAGRVVDHPCSAALGLGPVDHRVLVGRHGVEDHRDPCLVAERDSEALGVHQVAVAAWAAFAADPGLVPVVADHQVHPAVAADLARHVPSVAVGDASPVAGEHP